MNSTLKEKMFDRKTIVWVVIGAVVMYLVASVIVGARLQSIEDSILTQVNSHHEALVSLAKLTTGNEADPDVQAIIRDCSGSERERFYDLLGKLNEGLSQNQLSELDDLFGRCGDYFAVRKSITTARLQRELAVYVDLVHTLNLVTDRDDSEKYQLAQWEEFLAAEKQESDSYFKLVGLQEQIITTLLAGKAADSAQIKDILNEVNRVQTDLNGAGIRSSEIRGELIPT